MISMMNKAISVDVNKYLEENRDFKGFIMPVLSIFFVLFSLSAHADTLLVGFDSESPLFGNCFITDSTSIDGYSWKAFHMRALASGTIAYFKMGISHAPTGCTNDRGCWAIYDGTNGSNVVGALKAYSCFDGYDWTIKGISQNHTFRVTTVVTNLNVTTGNWYWVVFYSSAIDATHYTEAGCSAYPYTQRGRAACRGTMDYMQVATQSSVLSPPPGSTYDIPVQSYFAWGVWADLENLDDVPPSPPFLRDVQIEEHR